MDAQDVGELTLPPVTTCDGDSCPALTARRTSRLYYYVGFAALPWLWLCNCWLFSADFLHAQDPVVAKCEPVALVDAWRHAGGRLRSAPPPPRPSTEPAARPCRRSLTVQTRGDRPWALLCTPVSSCLGLFCT